METRAFQFNAPMFADFTSNLENHDVDQYFFGNSNNETSRRNTRLSIKQEVVSPSVSSSEVRKSLSMNSLIIKEEVKSPEELALKRRSPRLTTPASNNNAVQCRSRSRSCTSDRKTLKVLDSSNHEEILNQAIEGLTVSTKKKKPVLRKPGFSSVDLDLTAALSSKEHQMVTRLDLIKTPESVRRKHLMTKDGDLSILEKDTQDLSPSRKRKSVDLLELSCSTAKNHAAAVKEYTEANGTENGETTIVQNKKIRILDHAQNGLAPSASMSTHPRRSTVRFSEVYTSRQAGESVPESERPFNFAAKTESGTSAIFSSTSKRLQLTEPKIPKLRTARRSVMPNNNVKACVINLRDGVQTVKFQNILHSGLFSHEAKLAPTMPKPFSFEERDRQRFQRKEEKIRQTLEEQRKKAEFHANPLPAYINIKKEIPIPSTRSSTLSRKSIFQKYEQNEKENPAPTPFKAQRPTVLEKEPFIPKKANRPLLEIPDFELKTEIRAREREQFENQQKEKEMEKESLLREREQRRKQQEEAEIMRLRQEAVHKAQPIPKFQPPKIFPSLKPLTMPMSPKFSSRLMNRRQ